jgi:hypothetical protein
MNEIFNQWLKERPGFKALKDWHPSLIQSIIDRHPNTVNDSYSNISRLIAGGMGYGKTTLAFKFMAKLDYTVNGYTKIDDEENSYKFALDNIIYRPNDLFDRMEKQLEIGLPTWIWTIDDGSIHMGKQLYRQDRDAYDKLEDNLPTIREYVTCLLITTPKPGNLAKPFRDFFDKKINITLEEGIKRHVRRGKHYFREYYPDDVHYRIYHPWDDRYSCLVPEPFYGMLRQKKLDALKDYHASKKRKNIKEQYEDETEEEDSDAVS